MVHNNPDARAPAYSDDPGDFRVGFGKFAHRTLRQVATSSPGYFRWLQTINKPSPAFKEALRKFSESPEAKKAMRTRSRTRNRLTNDQEWALR